MARGKRITKILVEISRLVVGATFLFSGFVKAVDPLGFTYKIQDYLISFNLTELFPLSLPAAIVMVVAEFLIGVFVLLGIYRKLSVIAAALFMAFFLPLTLWIALKNPVKDCGCFGDAFIISNWETFYKNVALSACAVILLLYWKQITPLFSKRTAWMAAAFSLLFGIVFSVYNVVKLPVIDFRPFKIGAHIPTNMYVDPAKGDVFENIFVYSKNGESKEFTEDNYPWDDSTWTYVDMQTRLITEGEKPKIEDFAIEALNTDSTGATLVSAGDITEHLLSDENYNFLMIAYSLEDMNLTHLNDFESISEYAANRGYGFYCITSTPSGALSDWSKKHNARFNFTHADERVLKTMIRSNPGLMLIKNGTVINKWDDGGLPALSENDNFEEKISPRKNFYTTFTVIILLFLIPLILIKLTDLKRLNKTNDIQRDKINTK